MTIHLTGAWGIVVCFLFFWGAQDFFEFLYKIAYVLIYRFRHRREVRAVRYLTGIEEWVANHRNGDHQ